ncbi:hypothetical protein FPV67DRAFT_268502 [Lyophyllum atratum]|nr:hypothetical protein FPV67DRAFT_268502 [Lyophyllum atratum]
MISSFSILASASVAPLRFAYWLAIRCIRSLRAEHAKLWAEAFPKAIDAPTPAPVWSPPAPVAVWTPPAPVWSPSAPVAVWTPTPTIPVHPSPATTSLAQPSYNLPDNIGVTAVLVVMVIFALALGAVVAIEVFWSQGKGPNQVPVVPPPNRRRVTGPPVHSGNEQRDPEHSLLSSLPPDLRSGLDTIRSHLPSWSWFLVILLFALLIVSRIATTRGSSEAAFHKALHEQRVSSEAIQRSMEASFHKALAEQRETSAAAQRSMEAAFHKTVLEQQKYWGEVHRLALREYQNALKVATAPPAEPPPIGPPPVGPPQECKRAAESVCVAHRRWAKIAAGIRPIVLAMAIVCIVTLLPPIMYPPLSVGMHGLRVGLHALWSPLAIAIVYWLMSLPIQNLIHRMLSIPMIPYAREICLYETLIPLAYSYLRPTLDFNPLAAAIYDYVIVMTWKELILVIVLIAMIYGYRYLYQGPSRAEMISAFESRQSTMMTGLATDVVQIREALRNPDVHLAQPDHPPPSYIQAAGEGPLMNALRYL